MLQAVVEDNRYMATQATVPAAESDCLPRAPRKSGPSSPLISGRPGVRGHQLSLTRMSCF